MFIVFRFLHELEKPAQQSYLTERKGSHYPLCGVEEETGRLFRNNLTQGRRFLICKAFLDLFPAFGRLPLAVKRSGQKRISMLTPDLG
jgi:hypothetical protein